MTDDFASGVQATGDVVVGEAIGRIKDHLGAKDLIIRQRIFGGTTLQIRSLVVSELDFVWAGSWHMASMAGWPENSRHNTLVYF